MQHSGICTVHASRGDTTTYLCSVLPLSVYKGCNPSCRYPISRPAGHHQGQYTSWPLLCYNALDVWYNILGNGGSHKQELLVQQCIDD